MILISFLIWLFPIPVSGEARLQSPPWALPPMQSASYKFTASNASNKPENQDIDALGRTRTTVRLLAERLNLMLEQMSD